LTDRSGGYPFEGARRCRSDALPANVGGHSTFTEKRGDDLPRWDDCDDNAISIQSVFNRSRVQILHDVVAAARVLAKEVSATLSGA
jgi:hypothetical protein